MRPAPALVLALAAPVLPAAAQRLAYEGSLSVATGSYFFTARTTSWMLVTGIAATAGRVTLRASIPLYLQNTTLLSGSGWGMMPTGGSLGGTVADSGRARHGWGGMRMPVPARAVTGYHPALGDPVAYAGARLVETFRTSVAVGGAVKFPLTDTSQFGTGAWDAGATLSATRWLGGGFVALDLAFWRLGDLPDLELGDPLTASVTLGRRVGTDWIGSVFATGGTSALEGYPAPASIGAVWARTGAPAWTASVALGLTDAAPDLVVALAWRLGR
ncbi:MAG TPA: hypothetical protein VNI61_10410 [Gemmatimonadales bacterium]|nr:hypothetical protein [Gemmatimonadales bacterium]